MNFHLNDFPVRSLGISSLQVYLENLFSNIYAAIRTLEFHFTQGRIIFFLTRHSRSGLRLNKIV